MTYDFSTLNSLSRPKILIRAARVGESSYQRDRDLGRLFKSLKIPRGASVLGTLIEAEAALENRRVSGDCTYNIQQHVFVLTALLAEARVEAQNVVPLRLAA